ncbi:beta-1-3-galactosyltransferase 1-like [Brachionus plicatilis]|uniref:Hexosyltransferase n=1 Tax=Brachionus plicatilis TaxID=10195 RepID=A0A3M7SDR7_BRAPC|nr:beta-1-3-galactosyltransferase 1-like [Brachionus plicatilis]
MKWITEFCPKAKFILKVDDDIIANIFILMRHLHYLDKHKVVKNKTVMCLVWQGMIVMRDKNSKWYLSKDEFKDDRFGRYCSGSAYLFTNDLPREMFNASKYLEFFWVDDYYITGMLARGVQSNYEFFNSLYIISSNLVENRFLNRKTSDRTVFGHSPNNLNRIYKLWNFIMQKFINQFPNFYKEIPKNIWDIYLDSKESKYQEIIEYDNF